MLVNGNLWMTPNKGLDQSWKLTGEYAAERIDIGITADDVRALIQSIDAPSTQPTIIDITPL